MIKDDVIGDITLHLYEESRVNVPVHRFQKAAQFQKLLKVCHCEKGFSLSWQSQNLKIAPYLRF